MVVKNLCAPVLWTKVASALEARLRVEIVQILNFWKSHNMSSNEQLLLSKISEFKKKCFGLIEIV